MARRYFLFCYIFTCSLASVIGQSTTYALEGQEVKLTPNVPGRPDEILWKHNGSKVVDFNGNEQEVYGLYKNRITLNWHSAELSITQLSFEDSGDYVLELYMKNKLHPSYHKLEVIDKVAKPTISCHMNNGTSSNRSGTLLCSAEPRRPQNLMKFEWSSKGKVQPGPQLVISLGGEYDDEVHICRVSNPLSTETATFTSKDCYPVKSSPAALTASLVIIFITLIAVALGTMICKACFSKERRDDWETSSEENGTAEPLLDRTPALPSTQPLAGRVQHNRNMRPCDSASSQDKDTSSDTVQESKKEEDEDEEVMSQSVGDSEDTQQDLCGAASQQPEIPTSTPPDNRSTNSSEGFSATAHGDSDQEEEAKTREEFSDFEAYYQQLIQEVEPNTKSEKEENEDEEATSPLVNACDLQDETPPKDFVQQFLKWLEQNIIYFFSGLGSEMSKDKHKETASPPSSPPIESPSHVDQKNLASTNRSDADADQQSAEEEVPQSAHEPGPAGALEKEDGEDEEAKSPLANGVSPVAQPLSPLIQNSPTVAPEDPSAEHMEDTNLDQLSGETDRNLRESDFSGKEKTAESSEDKQPSTILKQEASETTPPETDSNLSQGEAHTNEDNRQKTDKPVCAVENKSESGGDSEGTQQDLCGAASQHHESPTSATPDNRSTNRSQGSSATPRGDSDQEEKAKTRKDSVESAEAEGETAESKNEIQCGPKEDKAGYVRQSIKRFEQNTSTQTSSKKD